MKKTAQRAFLVLMFITIACLPLGSALAGSKGDREVQHLLDYIAQSGCTFIRNGEEHTAQKAREHMEYKYGFGKMWIDDGDDFIKRIATESSTTGKKYTIRCQGKTEYTGEWLKAELQRYRSQEASAGSK